MPLGIIPILQIGISELTYMKIQLENFVILR